MRQLSDDNCSKDVRDRRLSNCIFNKQSDKAGSTSTMVHIQYVSSYRSEKELQDTAVQQHEHQNAHDLRITNASKKVDHKQREVDDEQQQTTSGTLVSHKEAGYIKSSNTT